MKKLLWLIAFLIFAALANAQDGSFQFQKLPVGVKSFSLSINVYDSTKTIKDTIYEVKNNKAYFTITTVFKQYPDGKMVDVKLTYWWNAKLNGWEFDSGTIEPATLSILLRGSSSSGTLYFGYPKNLKLD